MLFEVAPDVESPGFARRSDLSALPLFEKRALRAACLAENFIYQFKAILYLSNRSQARVTKKLRSEIW